MREQPLKELRAAFFGAKEPGQRIVVISGLGGSGKTQLALKFARMHDDM
jgi:DNA transposition AAA+ family ATPase